MHPGLEVKGLIADTVFELQEKLDVLYEVATKLGLIVNPLSAGDAFKRIHTVFSQLKFDRN